MATLAVAWRRQRRTSPRVPIDWSTVSDNALSKQLSPWLISHPHGGAPQSKKYKKHNYIFSLKGMVIDTGALTVAAQSDSACTVLTVVCMRRKPRRKILQP